MHQIGVSRVELDVIGEQAGALYAEALHFRRNFPSAGGDFIDLGLKTRLGGVFGSAPLLESSEIGAQSLSVLHAELLMAI